MAKTKTQHYVPQSYLKRFSGDGDYLFVLDKLQRKVFRSNVVNVACENYFYDFPEDGAAEVGIDPQAVERLLADIDTGFYSTVDAILGAVANRKRRRVIKPKQKRAMAYFLTIQLLRTREHRNLIAESLEKMGEALLLRMPDYSPEDFRVVADDEWVALLQSQFMLSPQTRETFMRALCGHIWYVGTNDTEQPFYTSDTPVVRRAHYHHPLRSFSGIASRGIEIALPLNPRCVLVLCERTAFKQYKGYDCKCMPLDVDNVTYYNSLQVFQSYRQVYCPVNRFDLAEKICDEHPEICTPERARLQVD